MAKETTALKTVEERVKQIIVEQVGVEASEVVPHARFVEDLGVDSLDSVEIVMALEEAFGLEIPDEHVEKMQTVESVYNYVRSNAKIRTQG